MPYISVSITLIQERGIEGFRRASVPDNEGGCHLISRPISDTIIQAIMVGLFAIHEESYIFPCVTAPAGNADIVFMSAQDLE